MIRLIPEYEPVDTVLLAFSHEFYNTRFGFGRAIADIASILRGTAEVEIFSSENDIPILLAELKRVGLDETCVRVTTPGPPECALNSFMPVFGSSAGALCGLTFRFLTQHEAYADVFSKCEEYSRSYLARERIPEVVMPFDFATARVAANSSLALVSSAHEQELGWFRRNIVQDCYAVPYLASEPTKDLDVFLLPARDSVWLLSQFEAGTPEEASVKVVESLLRNHDQEVIPIPGLPVNKHDDVNCLPNYANSLLVNGLAIVPQYLTPEDEVACAVFKELGYTVYGIDARRIAESNSVFHCISKTVPRR